MINLTVDISNLFFRSLYIVGGYKSDSYTFDNQFEVDQLMRKVCTDISFIIRQTNPSRVIFAFDSKSWRKSISIDENEGYKANREKSSTINWDNVYNIMKEFGDIIESNGFIVSKIDKAEADDIICLWNEELLFNQHQHNIIVSADEDVRQLVYFYPYEVGKNAFSVVYNPFTQGKAASKKLYIPKYFNEWLNTSDNGDIFNRSIDMDKEDFKQLRDTEKILLEEVNGNLIGLKKIFCGDDGDNVPSIYSWVVKDKKDEDKVMRITNSKYEKIVNLIEAKDYLDLHDKCDIIYEQISNIAGHNPSFKMIDRLNRQIKLVILSKTVFPEEIVETFENEKAKQLAKPNVSPQSWNMNSLLQGTRYVKASKSKGSEISLFKDTDKLNKYLF